MKKNLHTLAGSILVFLIASCNSKKLGQTNYSEDRKTTSGYSISTCSKPSKRYAKSLDVAVKASFDSLKLLPVKSIDASLKNTITHLADYTSEGLDFDLLNFRICELANSAGLSESAKEEIIKKSLDTWQAIMLQKSQKGTGSINVGQSGGINMPINVTNNNQSGGISTGVLVVPKDKEVPLNENFTISQITDTSISHVSHDKFVFALKPKVGTWFQPFFAIPAEEKDKVNGRYAPYLSPGGYVLMSNAGTLKPTAGPDTLSYHYESAQGQPVHPNHPFYLIFDKIPSRLIFGDLSDQSKIYIMVKS